MGARILDTRSRLGLPAASISIVDVLGWFAGSSSPRGDESQPGGGGRRRCHTDEDNAVDIAVLANDTDCRWRPDRRERGRRIERRRHGMDHRRGSAVSFDPGADFHDLAGEAGPVTFTYTVSDGSTTAVTVTLEWGGRRLDRTPIALALNTRESP